MAPADVINTSNNNPLCMAAIHGHQELVNVLINEHSCDPLVRGSKGYTLLHCASISGKTKLISDLISHLSPLVRDNDGNTPLHIAAEHGHGDVVIQLVNSFHVDVNIKNNAGNTPLHTAVLNNQFSLISTLITELGCNPETSDNENRTILHLGCSLGNAELVQLLLKVHKMSIFFTDNDGNTPLHITIARQHVNCVSVLLQHNAPLFIKNNSEAKAIDIANYMLQSRARLLVVQSLLKINIQQHSSSYIHSTYKDQQSISKKKFSGEKHVSRLFIVGHCAAGKTTLIESLKKEGFFSRMFGGTTVVPPHTAGIVPSTHDSDQYGRLVFYDFAGD